MYKTLMKTTLESMSETVVITEPDVATQVNPAPTAAEVMAQNEFDHDQAATDQLAAASISLEEVLAQLDEALDEGGASNRELNMARTAATAVAAPMGLDEEMPALESNMTRALATRLTMESVQETLKNVWKAIVEFCKRIWNAVLNFFTGQKQKSQKIHDEATSLIAKIKEKRAAGGVAGGHTTITHEHLASWVAPSNGMAPLEFLKAYSESCETTAKESTEAANAQIIDIVKSLEAAASKQGMYVYPTIKVLPLRSRFLKLDANAEIKKHGFLFNVYHSPTLPGGIVMKVVRPAGNGMTAQHSIDMATRRNDLFKVIGDETWTLEPSKDAAKTKDVAILDLNDLEALMEATVASSKAMIEACDKLIEMGKTHHAEIQKFETLSMKFGSVTQGHLGSDNNPTEALRAFQRLQRSLSAPSLCMYQYLGRLLGAYTSYAKVCLEQHGVKGGEAAPAADATPKPEAPKALPPGKEDVIDGEFSEVK